MYFELIYVNYMHPFLFLSTDKILFLLSMADLWILHLTEFLTFGAVTSSFFRTISLSLYCIICFTYKTENIF